MPQVTEHDAVGLAHLLADLLPVRIVGLRQIDRDDPVLMADHHVLTHASNRSYPRPPGSSFHEVSGRPSSMVDSVCCAPPRTLIVIGDGDRSVIRRMPGRGRLEGA